jgi:hypothetical protein
MMMTCATLGQLLLGSVVVSALLGCASGVQKVLSEVSLVSNLPGFNSASTVEVSRFLWEPGRYTPPPGEIFLELVGGAFGPPGGSTTFRLVDVATNVTIANSTLVVAAGAQGRFRTASLVASLPATSVEIKLMAAPTVGTAFSIQRSAILVQQ